MSARSSLLFVAVNPREKPLTVCHQAPGAYDRPGADRYVSADAHAAHHTPIETQVVRRRNCCRQNDAGADKAREPIATLWPWLDVVADAAVRSDDGVAQVPRKRSCWAPMRSVDHQHAADMRHRKHAPSSSRT